MEDQHGVKPYLQVSHWRVSKLHRDALANLQLALVCFVDPLAVCSSSGQAALVLMAPLVKSTTVQLEQSTVCRLQPVQCQSLEQSVWLLEQLLAPVWRLVLVQLPVRAWV